MKRILLPLFSLLAMLAIGSLALAQTPSYSAQITNPPAKLTPGEKVSLDVRYIAPANGTPLHVEMKYMEGTAVVGNVEKMVNGVGNYQATFVIPTAAAGQQMGFAAWMGTDWQQPVGAIFRTPWVVVAGGGGKLPANMEMTEPADALDALAPQTVISHGDPARLDRVLEKARAGDPITIGFIGGSVTEGAAASKIQYCYPSRVAQWFRRSFPRSKITLINAGVGATGSRYGCLRVQGDLLAHHPDLVVVEYAINDYAPPGAADCKMRAKTYEGVIRQILSAANHPAVIELFVAFSRDGHSAEAQEEHIGWYYHLPMISHHDAILGAILSGAVQWFGPDGIQGSATNPHPNDRGHALIAYFITHFLQQCLSRLPTQANLPAIKPLPKPLYAHNPFTHTWLQRAADMKVVANHGWEIRPHFIITAGSWCSDQPGSVITFLVRGRAAFLYMTYYRHGGNFGQVSVQVDHNPPQVLDAFFPAWWSFCKTDLLASNLAPGTHTVRVELLAQKDPKSSGHLFGIVGLEAAGTGAAH